ncbi:MAG: hypothetical protein ACREJ3_14400, partial [Polyangiaceae bacterium]
TDQIIDIKTSPAFPSCQASQANSCPSGWTTGVTSAVVPGQPLPLGIPAIRNFYACYPPIDPPPGCSLLTQTAVPPKTTVTTGNTTQVTLTLCENAACSNGVRAACLQNCTLDSDCDNNLTCKNDKCVPSPRLVKITDENIQGIVTGGCSTSQANAFTHLEVTCDPNATPNLTDPLCNAQHLNFCSTPITGGTADKTVLLDGNGDCNALQFHFVCTMDPLGSGGILVGTDMNLLDGCGSGAEVEDQDEGGPDQQWLATLAPATPQNQTPAPAVCILGGANEAPDRSWKCDAPGLSCWHDNLLGIIPTACGPCEDNEADVGPAGMSYANVPKP